MSAELGTHKSVAGSDKALATVTSVIDGTGSLGAALGPFLAAAIGLQNVFYMLMASDVLALCVSLLCHLQIHIADVQKPDVQNLYLSEIWTKIIRISDTCLHRFMFKSV